jgi:hypothetical protein
MLSAVLVGVGSIPIFWISRRSLLRPSSYGFYRFFAVESILALIVLNAPKWFTRPFSAPQLASWLLLLVSVFTVISGSLTDLRHFGPAAISLIVQFPSIFGQTGGAARQV